MYISDCVAYLKPNQVLLTSWFGRTFRLNRSGFRLAGVLPCSQAILSQDLPFHCTPHGVYVVSDQSAVKHGIADANDFIFISLQELALVEVKGKNIHLNRSHTLKTLSSASAQYQAAFLKELKNARLSDRQEKIKKWLKDSVDLQKIKKIQQAHSRAFTAIGFLSSNLFLVVFFVLPVVLYTNLADHANLMALAMCILLLYFLLLVATFLTVGGSSQSDKDAKIHTVLSIVLSPVNALHVLGYLTKNLYSRFNYLALAAYFVPREDFRHLVRQEIITIDHVQQLIGRQDWQDSWIIKKEILDGLLDACMISPAEILSQPERRDQSAVSYCPYCLAEYQKPRDNCLDCNVTLRRFKLSQLPPDSTAA